MIIKRGIASAICVTALVAGCSSSGSDGSSNYGADPSALASKAGCAVSGAVESAEAESPVKYQRVSCTINGKTVELDTYPSSGDQSMAEAAGASFVTASGAYASGTGWLAFEENYDRATAQTFADALGGDVKAGSS